MSDFSKWWREIGYRQQCFTAEEWARAGWLAHKLHADTWPDYGVIDSEQKILLDEKPETQQ